MDVRGQAPRIGVFVCRCGINIAGVVDVPGVAEYARTLPNVVYVEDNLFSCSQDTQDKMAKVIKEQNLNRIVVAACTPRTHEPLFQETVLNAGSEQVPVRDGQHPQPVLLGPRQRAGSGHGKSQGPGAHGGFRAALLEPLPRHQLGDKPFGPDSWVAE